MSVKLFLIKYTAALDCCVHGKNILTAYLTCSIGVSTNLYVLRNTVYNPILRSAEHVAASTKQNINCF